MSATGWNKAEAVAESIIRCEGLTFALAVKVGRDSDLRNARTLLKERLIQELMRAAGMEIPDFTETTYE